MRTSRYFADLRRAYADEIDDLLTDTFAQYVERSAAFMGKLWVRNEGLLREMVAYGDGSPQSRSQLADDIAAQISARVLRANAVRACYPMGKADCKWARLPPATSVPH